MRVSIDQRDHGYSEAIRLGIDIRFMRIWLDDVGQPNAVIADDESGFVVRWLERQGPNGPQFVPLKGGRGGYMRELVRGVVRIELLAMPNGQWPHAEDLKPDDAPRRWPGLTPPTGGTPHPATRVIGVEWSAPSAAS